MQECGGGPESTKLLKPNVLLVRFQGTSLPSGDEGASVFTGGVNQLLCVPSGTADLGSIMMLLSFLVGPDVSVAPDA